MMEDKEAKPSQEGQNIQSESKLTQSSSVSITPPKQESAKPPDAHPSAQIQPNNNVVEPPESTTKTINVKRSQKEETPEFLKGPSKKLDKKARSWFIGTLMILSLAILACSVTLVLFCLKEMPMPKFIQPAINSSYKFIQVNFGQNKSLSPQLSDEDTENDNEPIESSNK